MEFSLYSTSVFKKNNLMDFIKTVEKLVETLNNTSPSDYAKVFRKIRFNPDDFKPFCTWNKEGYTRNGLIKTPSYEIILLCWDAGAKTPIHGHGGKDCWVYQLDGTLEEVRFKEQEGDLIKENNIELSPGKLTYMNDQMGYHTLENISDQRSMTLHIYAAPIDSCKIYNDYKQCFEVQDMCYHTYWEKELESAAY